MPLSKRWAPYDGPSGVSKSIGAYELAYNKNVIYIGSGEIRNRVARHDNKGWNITHVRYEVTRSTRRARQIERRELKQFKENNGRLPKYNDKIP